MGSINVSTLILTLNEEINLPRCLHSLSWCDDVVILDSYSNDRTEVIAREAGARFIQRDFDNYANQRNYGLNDVKYKYPWLLMVDADEVTPQNLTTEIQNTLAKCDEEISLFRMRRKDYFRNKWIRYSSGYPTWFGRLARIGKVNVKRAINEEYHTDGKIGHLQSHLLHYPFNKGFHAWLEKHNRYSTMEAEEMMSKGKAQIHLTELYNSDPIVRRKTIKEVMYSLPGRPLLMFCGLYFLRRGFLDGKAGLTYCLLRTIYEYMIDCKAKEIKLRQNKLPL